MANGTKLGCLNQSKGADSMEQFFLPMSKRRKLGKEVVIPEKVDDKSVTIVAASKLLHDQVLTDDFAPQKRRRKSQFPEKEKSSAIVSKVMVSKPKPEVDEPQPQEISHGSQPSCQNDFFAPLSTKRKQQAGGQADGKSRTRACSAKKRVSAQQVSGGKIKNPSSVEGVCNSDLRTQAKLAAEENARLSEGKAPHPFFARQKAIASKSLIWDEILRSEEAGSLLPCPPLHVIQHTEVVKDGEQERSCGPSWDFDNGTTTRNKTEEGHAGKFTLCCPPLFLWTWATEEGAGKGCLSPVEAALQQLVAYLKAQAGNARIQPSVAKGVESENADRLSLRNLVERFSSYYSRQAHIDDISVSQLPEPGQTEAYSCSQNPLWTDRYQPQSSQEVCGNRHCVEALSRWLRSWQEKSLSHKGPAKKKDAASGDSDSGWFEDEPDSFSDEDDDDDLPKSILVTGPVGCGKSAAIYACAREQGYTVIEVNASDCRSGALIKHKFKEAMESHGLSNRSAGNRATTAILAGAIPSGSCECMTKKQKNSETFESGNMLKQEIASLSQQPLHGVAALGNCPPPSSLRKMRVILFEDVDMVFEEDSGFMGAVVQLSATTKCPIVLTTNNQEPALPQLRKLQTLEFQCLSTMELVTHAYMVCLAEGVGASPATMENIVKACNHDLRKSLMLLQFWGQGLSTATQELGSLLPMPSTFELPHIVSKQHIRSGQVVSAGLEGCLLQLDGCPQGSSVKRRDGCPQISPAARTVAFTTDLKEKMLAKGEDRSKHPKVQYENGKTRTPRDRGNAGKANLDWDWLLECDAQHRILPHLFGDSLPCQLAQTIAVHLLAMQQNLEERAALAAAYSAHKRAVALQAEVEAASKARKALKKLQDAARRESNASGNQRTAHAGDDNENLLNGGDDLMGRDTWKVISLTKLKMKLRRQSAGMRSDSDVAGHEMTAGVLSSPTLLEGLESSQDDPGTSGCCGRPQIFNAMMDGLPDRSTNLTANEMTACSPSSPKLLEDPESTQDEACGSGIASWNERPQLVPNSDIADLMEQSAILIVSDMTGGSLSSPKLLEAPESSKGELSGPGICSVRPQLRSNSSIASLAKESTFLTADEMTVSSPKSLEGLEAMLHEPSGPGISHCYDRPQLTSNSSIAGLGDQCTVLTDDDMTACSPSSPKLLEDPESGQSEPSIIGISRCCDRLPTISNSNVEVLAEKCAVFIAQEMTSGIQSSSPSEHSGPVIGRCRGRLRLISNGDVAGLAKQSSVLTPDDMTAGSRSIQKLLEGQDSHLTGEPSGSGISRCGQRKRVLKLCRLKDLQQNNVTEAEDDNMIAVSLSSTRLSGGPESTCIGPRDQVIESELDVPRWSISSLNSEQQEGGAKIEMAASSLSSPKLLEGPESTESEPAGPGISHSCNRHRLVRLRRLEGDQQNKMTISEGDDGMVEGMSSTRLLKGLESSTNLSASCDSMKDVWLTLRGSRQQFSSFLSPDSRHAIKDSCLLAEVLSDLSVCDVLSTVGGPGADEYGKVDTCRDVAASLAQVRLNQALDHLHLSGSLPSHPWHINPPCLQQELIRQEKQAGVEKVVRAVVPPRISLLGSPARQEYWAFLGRISHLEEARRGGPVDTAFPTSRRQRRPEFQHYLSSRSLSDGDLSDLLQHTLCAAP